MARTRLAEEGWEFAHDHDYSSISAWDSYEPGLSFDEKTGSHGVRFIGQNTRFWWDIPATSQVSIGWHLFHSGGVSTGDEAHLVTLRTGTTDVLTITFDGTNLNAFTGAYNGTLLESVACPKLARKSHYRHIGVDVKLNATGWVYVYVDGVEYISFDGDTTAIDTTCDRVMYGNNAGQYWNNYLHLDDIIIDDTTGEGSPTLPPDLRLLPLYADGNGNYNTGFTGSDGNTVDNYLMVDDPDVDTSTYLSASATAAKDSFTMGDTGAPLGFDPIQVIGLVTALKESAGNTLDLQLGTRASAVDDLATVATAAQLSTSYLLFKRRFPLDPSGGAWTYTSIDGMELIIATS